MLRKLSNIVAKHGLSNQIIQNLWTMGQIVVIQGQTLWDKYYKLFTYVIIESLSINRYVGFISRNLTTNISRGSLYIENYHNAMCALLFLSTYDIIQY